MATFTRIGISMMGIRTSLGLCVTAIVTSAMPALAQTPQITSPAANQIFRAGPDYATDVLHDPWDFSNIEDISPFPDDHLGWAESDNARLAGPSVFAFGGRFIANSNTHDPIIGLLYQGISGTVVPGRSGLRYPIDASRYSKAAFRMNASNAAGTPPAIIWFFGAKPVAANAMGSAAAASITAGERVYQIDLAGAHSGAAYQGAVRGLRFDPTDVQGRIELDWFRLTAPDGHPDAAMMPVVTTNCRGARTADVLDGATSTRVLQDSSNNGSFNYGIFPPGNYTLRVGCNGAASDRAFVIKAPPQVTVLQPDERGAADYATTVLNNPWNFDHPADVPVFNNVQFLPDSTPGRLHARNTGPSLGDTQLFLLHREGGARPIATTRYRYLTFTLGLNYPFSLTATDGSVARVFWGSDPIGFDGHRQTTTGPILVWPGYRTYTIDLAALSVADGTLEPCPSCIPWTARSARFFRLDPSEFGTQQVDFFLSTVTLAAPYEVVEGGSFPIRWATSPLGPGSTASIYIDTNTSFADGAVRIDTVPASDGVFTWQANVTPGDYYVYVQVTEPGASNGSATRGAYSTGVLRVIGAANGPVVTIATHAPGGSAYAPFTIGGCAYNAATGVASDEVFVYAHPLEGQFGGVPQILGYNAAGGMGVASPVSCGSGPGYQVSNIFALPQGRWTFRTIARNRSTGDFDEVQAQNVMVEHRSPPPRNFRLVSVIGNRVSVAWDPPAGGRAVRGYRIEAAGNPEFRGATPVILPPQTTSASGTIANGTYYLRVVAANDYSIYGLPSNVVNFVLPGGHAVAPPGPVTLGGQVSANPVTLQWSQAGGGAAVYTIHAGSRSGTSDVAILPMGGATSLPPVVLSPGTTVYARIVASNAGGSTVSNEVLVKIPLPGAPIQLAPTVSRDRTVTIRWLPPANGSVPTSYAVVARYPGAPAIIKLLRGLTGTSLTVPNAPTGTYVVTVAALYGNTPSAESNAQTVNVP